jgi:hypothetical protein
MSFNGRVYPQTAAEHAVRVVPSNYSYEPGDVRRYGADPTGVANSAPAFASALMVKGTVTARGIFQINSGLMLDVQTTQLVGPCTLNSGLPANAGPMITIVSSANAGINNIFGLSRIVFSGTGVTGVQGINIAAVAPNTANNFAISHCAFNDLATGVQITNEAWEVEFHQCNWSLCGSDNAALYIAYEGSERISLVQGAFYNCTECVRQNSGGQLFMDNVSLDYSTRLVVCNSGQVFMSHCYIEGSFNTGYGFNATGRNPASLIKLDDCMISIIAGTPPPSYNIGASAGGYGGGIYMRGCKLYVGGTSTIINPLIAGAGYAFVKDTIVEGFTDNAYAWGGASAAANLINNGAFRNGLNGWTYGSNTGRGGNPTVDSNTLILKVSLGGQDQFAYWTVIAEPGQNIGVTVQAKSNSASAGFRVLLEAVGADDATIATSRSLAGYNLFGVSNPLETTTYQSVYAAFLNLPAGTATVRVHMDTAGASSPAYSVYVRKVTASKY